MRVRCCRRMANQLTAEQIRIVGGSMDYMLAGQPVNNHEPVRDEIEFNWM